MLLAIVSGKRSQQLHEKLESQTDISITNQSSGQYRLCVAESPCRCFQEGLALPWLHCLEWVRKHQHSDSCVRQLVAVPIQSELTGATAFSFCLRHGQWLAETRQFGLVTVFEWMKIHRYGH